MASGSSVVRTARHLGIAGGVTAAVVGVALVLFGPGGDLDPAAAEQTVAAASLDVLDALVEVGPGGTDFATGADNQTLDLGDVVRTDATGFAQVDFSDGSLARVDGDSELTILALDGDALAPQITVRVDVGRTWHRVQGVTGEAGAYEVETAVGTAAVRGTAFVVDCDPDACTISVWEGVVELARPDGTIVRIEAGEVVRIPVEGDEERREGTPDDLRADDDWVDTNVELDEATGRFGSGSQDCAATLDGRNAALATVPERAIELDVSQAAQALGRSRVPIDAYDIRLSLLGQEFTAGSGTVTGDRTTFSTTIAVDEYAVFGVGLYEVAAVTTGAECRLDAFVRVTGRHPLTTVAGLLGLALSVLGLALLSSAVRGGKGRGGRRLRGVVSGAMAGVGLSVLVQQFGALPLTAGLLGGLVGVGVAAGALAPRPARPAAPPAAPPASPDPGGEDEA